MWKLVLYDLFSYGIFVYSVTLLSSYIFIGLYSIGETRKHLRKGSFTDYNLLASSDFAPSVTILAPAYNEGANIIENVRSLLSIHYNHLELIVINDGSKDDSMQKLIAAYDLEPVEYPYHQHIATKPIKAVYKSKNSVYRKLVVIDKVNGGKADALNTGINLAANKYLVCIDVDCILEQDALLKLVKPFIEETDKQVIATGGVVRIANSCVVQNGRLLDVNLPKQFLPRVQTLEYIRAFLLGRMAWSRLNGLLLISGAFGAFDRDIVIKAGGYDHKTVGEDMELVVRMRRYMEENDIPYKVAYIPDPLCWTEAPSTYKILGRQRNRWTRGTIETLKIHRVMFFNPRYGLLGMLSYPYWFFFEFLAPIIEFIGIVGFIIFAIFGVVNWTFFFALLGFVLTFGWLYSIFAILMEVLTYNQYKKRGEVAKLVLTAILEPFLFHPFGVWSAIRGNIDLIRKKNSWGEMTRQGFHAQATAATEKITFATKLRNGLFHYLPLAACWLFVLLLSRLGEFIYNGNANGYPQQPATVLGISYLNDLVFFLKASCILAVLYMVLSLAQKRIADGVIGGLMVLLTLGNLALMQYFSLSFVPLGADIFGYNIAEIRQTVGAAGGLNLSLIIAMVVAALSLPALFRWLAPKLQVTGKWINLGVAIIAVLWMIVNFALPGKYALKADYASNLSKNKLNYFLAESFLHFLPARPATNNTLAVAGTSPFRYVDEAKYPFLHTDSSADVLGPFLRPTDTPPDIVIILVEGLGRAFTNDKAYLGSFTPFLDSLSRQGLYWENFLSNGGRTFAALPAVLGSLPFGNTGFNEWEPDMPQHFSLPSILKANGYRTALYYGGDAGFDRMDKFMQRQAVDSIYDLRSFPADWPRLPENNGFSWGYGDKELYRQVLQKSTALKNGSPSLQVVLTVATHTPFLVNEQSYYLQQAEKRLAQLQLEEGAREDHRKYLQQYAAILYADDALRNFFSAYRALPQYANTIFLITGDHRLPEIPMASKIDRYHVPLIVYSTLLDRTARFASVSTHNDITPSLLALLSARHQLRVPGVVSWVGEGIDTARAFRNRHTSVLKQTKTNLVDVVSGEYHLNEQTLFRLNDQLGEDVVTDDKKKAELMGALARYRDKNARVVSGAPLVPDSLYKAFYPNK